MNTNKLVCKGQLRDGGFNQLTNKTNGSKRGSFGGQRGGQEEAEATWPQLPGLTGAQNKSEDGQKESFLISRLRCMGGKAATRPNSMQNT